MNFRDWIYVGLMFGTYWLGDIFTTWYALNNGGYEANLLLASGGLWSTILLKTLFMFVCVALLSWMDSISGYKTQIAELKGIVVGSVCMVGIIAMLINTGFFA